MKRSFAGIRVVLLLACVPQVVASQGALAQGVEFEEGSRARVVLRDRIAPFLGKVIETSDDGFTIEVGGEFQPRRVNFAAVESLERSLRLGRRTRVGAVIGGGIAAPVGFLLAYCFQIFDVGCAGDLRAGMAGLGVGAAIGVAVGGGVGWLFTHYGPWEDVPGFGAPGQSGALDRLSVDVLPYPDGRIGLGVSLSLGGGR